MLQYPPVNAAMAAVVKPTASTVVAIDDGLSVFADSSTEDSDVASDANAMVASVLNVQELQARVRLD